MSKVFQFALETIFGLIIATCAVPTDDAGKDMNIEPIRFVCVVEFDDDKFMVAGQAFGIEDDEGEIIAGEWQ